MKTYKEGYAWGTDLTQRIDGGKVKRKVAEDWANSPGGGPSPYRQGIIDACADWLRKMQVLDSDIAREENRLPSAGPRTHETAH